MTAEEHNLTGLTLARQRHFDQAAAEFRWACELMPGFVEAHYNLAKSLKDAGHFDESIEAYRRTLALDPKVPAAWNNLGNLLKHSRRADEAIDAYRHVLDLEPNNAEAYSNLGAALQDNGDLDEAIKAYEHALALRPQFPDAARNLGSALYEAGRIDESVGHFQQALRLRLDFAEAFHGLGAALHDLGRYEDAAEAFQKGLAIRPGDPNCAYSLGLVRLVQGRLKEGFALYESRLLITGTRKAMVRDFPQPRWDGTELHGRRILLHAEQGFGDTIQFIRYASQVGQRGGHVIVQCPTPLVRLLDGQLGTKRVVSYDQPAPDFEVHCPMLSQPYVFGTTVENIPAQVPYLNADRKLMEAWRERLEDGEIPASRPLRVGLAWAGAREHNNDRNRSLSLKDFLPLLDTSGARFLSLQKGEAAIQAREVQSANLLDWTDELFDFADTAALIANLDLVISVDTAVAHLAGAMGKPVWVLLPYAPDWRWMLRRSDTPWYPTVRLFRQQRMGEWNMPLRQVGEALTETSGRLDRTSRPL